MSTNISEGLPAKKKAAPVVAPAKGGQESGGKKGGTAENSAKRIRQAVYDIRYRARREDIDLKQAFSQYMSNTSMDQKDRERFVQNYLVKVVEYLNSTSVRLMIGH